VTQSDPLFEWLTLIRQEGETSYCYRDLKARVEDFCSFYNQRQIRAGETILIILKESLDLFASFMAAIIHGSLPAYYAYPSPKQSIELFLSSMVHLFRHNQIRLVLVFEEVLPILARHADLLGSSGAEYSAHTNVPRGGAEGIIETMSDQAEAFLQFSSGTTGAKKGVKISSEALFNQIDAYEPCVRFDSHSRVVSWLPHYHDMGLIACMLMPFLKRVPIYMMSPFEWVQHPAMLLEAITRHKGTHVWLPNFALGHLVRTVDKEAVKSYDLGSLQKLICCSEPVLPSTVEAFINHFAPANFMARSLFNCYAMAENTFAMTSTRQGPIPVIEIDEEQLRAHNRVVLKHGGRKVASTGAPLSNITIKIMGGNGSTLEADQVGEVAIKSNCMLECYHNNKEETQAAFSEGFFKTGDLGFFHDGELYITGRKKDLIIVGGENVYPQDIEQILNVEPGFIPGRNVAFGVDDDRVGTERIVILAEIESSAAALDLDKLRSKILSLLNISVSEIIVLPHMSLLKSTAGKVSRQLNKNAYLQGRFGDVSAGSGCAEHRLMELVLSVIPGRVKPSLTLNSPLLTSGLVDSFGFAAMITLLEKEYHVKIPRELCSINNFDTLQDTQRTIDLLISGRGIPPERRDFIKEHEESRSRLLKGIAASIRRWQWRELLVNNFPWPAFVYRRLLRLMGVKIGRNVVFLGRIKIKIRGRPENIIIGDNVTLADGIDLRNRENGKIILSDGAFLDERVRMVAARDGVIQVGKGVDIGPDTIINSGGIVSIGEFAMIAARVMITSSTHGTFPQKFIKEQAYTHGRVDIGDDVWIGAGTSILANSNIGKGAIVGANSLVSGVVPSFAVCVGVPAKIIRYR